MLFRDLAQRIAGLDRVGTTGGSASGARRRRGSGGRGRARGGGAACDADVRNDLLLPLGNGLDGVPDLVLVVVRCYGSGEMQLAITLLGVALEAALRCLDRMRLLVSQTHQ